ncbi:hypothetical protein GJ744_008340 [Endocarpon pusillum]|uniref:DUF676 domain-containing protein n=1 Tax=Endocarpon pusillum TaxID=364733 RepID=A0A8H7E5N1_9EURO|nr:hypothetical protein GJ744_008340 [Endocarpon pusillum]
MRPPLFCKSFSTHSRPALEVLYPDPPKADADVEIDIIAGELRNVNWLKDQDMLPSVVPKARVMVYSYDSKWHMDAPRTRLSIVGEDLIRSVHGHRQGHTDRPIIFIGHSLGGNVILNGLLYANSEPEFSYLPKLIAGLVFLGSPF